MRTIEEMAEQTIEREEVHQHGASIFRERQIYRQRRIISESQSDGQPCVRKPERLQQAIKVVRHLARGLVDAERLVQAARRLLVAVALFWALFGYPIGMLA